MNSAAAAAVCGSQETKQMNSSELFSVRRKVDVFFHRVFGIRARGWREENGFLVPSASRDDDSFEIICISFKV